MLGPDIVGTRSGGSSRGEGLAAGDADAVGAVDLHGIGIELAERCDLHQHDIRWFEIAGDSGEGADASGHVRAIHARHGGVLGVALVEYSRQDVAEFALVKPGVGAARHLERPRDPDVLSECGGRLLRCLVDRCHELDLRDSVVEQILRHHLRHGLETLGLVGSATGDVEEVDPHFLPLFDVCSACYPSRTMRTYSLFRVVKRQNGL